MQLIFCTYSDRSNNCLTLISELFDMNMYDYIRNRKRCLSEVRVKNFLYQLCGGLNHLHLSGIFHRDIKPENILIKVNKRMKSSNLLKVKNIMH